MAGVGTALVALAFTSASAQAQDSAALAAQRAKETTPLRLSFGGGVAGRWAGTGPGDAVVPIEVTLTRWQIVSLSAGGVVSGVGVAHAYGELGFWVGISLGAGAGYGAYQSPTGRKDGGTVHLFVGVPIPMSGADDVIQEKPWYTYLLPYYRPSWGPWPGTAHEVGFMVKVSYGIVRGNWLGIHDL